MSSILGREITANVIHNWLAPGRDVSRIPCCFVPAFVEATGCDLVLRFLLGRNLATLLKLGELTARAVPTALNRLEKVSPASSDTQRSLFA